MKQNFLSTIIFTMLIGISVLAQIQNNSVIAKGQWKGSNIFHKAEGSTSLVKMNQGLYITLSNDFKVTQGPDLFLMLRNSKNNSTGMFTITLLKQYAGGQMYKVNLSEQDLVKYDQVIIYCRRFSTLFGFAQLNFNPRAFGR